MQGSFHIYDELSETLSKHCVILGGPGKRFVRFKSDMIQDVAVSADFEHELQLEHSF